MDTTSVVVTVPSSSSSLHSPIFTRLLLSAYGSDPVLVVGTSHKICPISCYAMPCPALPCHALPCPALAPCPAPGSGPFSDDVDIIDLVLLGFNPMYLESTPKTRVALLIVCVCVCVCYPPSTTLEIPTGPRKHILHSCYYILLLHTTHLTMYSSRTCKRRCHAMSGWQDAGTHSSGYLGRLHRKSPSQSGGVEKTRRRSPVRSHVVVQI